MIQNPLAFLPSGHGGLTRCDAVYSKGLHNYAYPRTDPVIIMGILDPTGKKMLMGRQVSPNSWSECTSRRHALMADVYGIR